MTSDVRPAAVEVEQLRCLISDKYTEVAKTPERGFHFHTGKPLALMLGYPEETVDALPSRTVESFAGTGNPFSMGDMHSGETVLDVGCGAGFDTIIAARQIGLSGRVISVDMTPGDAGEGPGGCSPGRCRQHRISQGACRGTSRRGCISHIVMTLLLSL